MEDQIEKNLDHKLENKLHRCGVRAGSQSALRFGVFGVCGVRLRVSCPVLETDGPSLHALCVPSSTFSP